MDVENELRQQTEKMLNDVKAKRQRVAAVVKAMQKEFLENVDAYITDTSYFLQRKDFVRAFEAVVWSWAWIEILERLGLLKEKNGDQNGSTLRRK